MAEANVIDAVVERIADGVPIDWPAVQSDAQTDQEREYLKCLQIVSGVADVHRTGELAEAPLTASMEETMESTAHGTATAERTDQWGRYRLVQKIGEGSFGSVYRAWDPELERRIAIKILHQRIAHSELKQRLLREGRALAKIRHPNVVDVFGIESDGDRVGLCMEFVDGKTLDSTLRHQGTLKPREARLVGLDVCRALVAVHSAGFVHRDVKARNVMRERSGRIVLMDFGTGRQMEHPGRGGRRDMAGTPVYMAPEVLAGEPATPTSDVYSVGVLMYHLVTGGYPVEGRSMADLRDAHRQRRLKLLGDRRDDLPPRFVQVVERALASDPQQRFPTAAALLAALEAIGKSPKRYFLEIGSIVAGTGVALVLLGILSSRAFNASLGRSDFSNEGVWDWLSWGARSCVGPVVLLMIAFLSMGVVVVLRKLLLAASNSARTLDARVRDRMGAFAARLHLNDASALASVVLLLSAASLIVAWWYFSPLLGALLESMDLSTAPAESLKLLAPGPTGSLNDYHVNYRKTFSWIAIVSIIAWYVVERMARRKEESLHWGVRGGAAAVILLALALLDYPFRLMNYWGTQFDVARWQGINCYILGERRDDVLLFCPSLQPSRNRVVKNTDATLERTGLRESIFTSFGQTKSAQD